MSDLISRREAIDAIRKSASDFSGFMEMEMYTVDDAITAVNTVPSAESVRHGKWRQTYLDHEAFGERPSIFYCSACCACSNVKTNYCPNCGADMRGEE